MRIAERNCWSICLDLALCGPIFFSTNLCNSVQNPLTKDLLIGLFYAVQHTRDGNRSGRPAGRVAGRVEILRPAAQAG